MYPYLHHEESGAIFSLPYGSSLDTEVSIDLLEWACELTGLCPDLDLMQDPDAES